MNDTGHDPKCSMRQKCAGFSVLKFTGFYYCTDFAVHKTILNNINVYFRSQNNACAVFDLMLFMIKITVFYCPYLGHTHPLTMNDIQIWNMKSRG